MKNHQVAEIFRHLADLLELKGDRIFRIRAYRRAAQVIETLPEAIESVAGQGKLEELQGIGKDLAAKIGEILETGNLAVYEEAKEQVPRPLLEFLFLPELEPQVARYLVERLGIENLDDLERMVRTHMLRTLPGFNKEREEKLLRSIRKLKERDPALELPI